MTEYDWMGEEWDKQMWEEYELKTFGKKMSMHEKLMSLPKHLQHELLNKPLNQIGEKTYEKYDE